MSGVLCVAQFCVVLFVFSFSARLCAYVLEMGFPFQYHQKFVCQLGGKERSDDVCGEDDAQGHQQEN